MIGKIIINRPNLRSILRQHERKKIDRYMLSKDNSRYFLRKEKEKEISEAETLEIETSLFWG